MTTPQQNPAYLFENYFGPSLFQPWGRKLVEAASPQPDEAILDLATATGTVARLIAAKGENSVHALDFSPGMLAVAREAAAREQVEIHWVEGSASDMPYEDDQFDLVVSQQGLQFFPDRVAAAKEIYRVLKPGGRLVANVWQDLGKHELWGTMFKAVATRLDAPMSAAAVPFMMGSADTLSSYLQAGGFTDVTVTQDELVTRFPEPNRFIQLSVSAAGAAIPTFAQMDPDTRASVVADLVETLSGEIGSHIEDDYVVMPTYLNQVIAVK